MKKKFLLLVIGVVVLSSCILDMPLIGRIGHMRTPDGKNGVERAFTPKCNLVNYKAKYNSSSADFDITPKEIDAVQDPHLVNYFPTRTYEVNLSKDSTIEVTITCYKAEYDDKYNILSKSQTGQSIMDVPAQSAEAFYATDTLPAKEREDWKAKFKPKSTSGIYPIILPLAKVKG